MRVLILHSRYLSGWVSGENRVVADETRLLREAEHEVKVWLPTPEEGGVRTSVGNGLNAVWSRSAIRSTRDILEEFHPDVAHCHNLFPTLSPAILRSLSERTTVVMTLHNYRMLCLPATLLREGRICELCVGKVPWRGVWYRCYRNSALGSGALAGSLTFHKLARSFNKVTRFLAGSRYLKQKHVSGGWPEHRILVKPNFCWETSRRTGPGEYFLYLGRLSSEKGVEILLRAWHGIETPLLIAGDGADRRNLEEIAPPNVQFLGSVSPEEGAALLQKARALMIPSVGYEGAPRSIVEAYAAGVPIVGSAIGAIPEFVSDGRSGYLTPAGDIGALASATYRLLDDDVAVRLGEHGYQLWRRRYTPEAGLKALEGSYRIALQSG